MFKKWFSYPNGKHVIEADVFCSHQLQIEGIDNFNNEENYKKNVFGGNCDIYNFNSICPSKINKKCKNMGQTSSLVKLYYHNVQSLFNKLIHIEIMLSGQYQSVDILCFVEHWMEEDMIKMINISNFNLASFSCRSKFGKGGTCIFVKYNLKFVALNLGVDCVDKDFEFSAVKLVPSNTVILCVYRSPSGCSNAFMTKFSILLDKIVKSYKAVIICGDFNYNLFDHSGLLLEFLALVQSHNIIIHNSSPTRVTNSSATLIDLCMSNVTDELKVQTTSPGFSDHFSLLVDIPLPSKNNRLTPNFVYTRNYNEDSIKEFCKALENDSWGSVYASPSPNTKFEKFYKTFLYYFNFHFPLLRIKEKNANSKLWITKEIADLKNLKEFLYYYIKNHKSKDMTRHYKEVKRMYNAGVSNMKKQYYGDSINRSRNKSKSVWNIVKRETKGSVLNCNENLQINDNGSLVSDPVQIVEIFNDYFISAPNKIIKNIKSPLNPNNVQQIVQGNKYPPIYLPPVTDDEIRAIAKAMRGKMSGGLDCVPDKIIKAALPCISNLIVHLCNSSISNGVFPSVLKNSIVKPLFKKGDKNSVSNYRPISLLSGFSKIFEKVMLSRLLNHLSVHRVICPEQNGFRKGKSTSSALYDFVTNAIEGIDKKHFTLGVFLDFQKAFDVVDHSILLGKMVNYGITGVALDWFQSYLLGRQQMVEISHIDPVSNYKYCYQSAKQEIQYGVPQGSVLGPVLFLIFINDLPASLKSVQTVLFADDTNLLVKGDSYNVFADKLNKCLNDLENWLFRNSMALNINKTCCLDFSRMSKPDLDVSLFSEKLSFVNDIKFLGVNLNKEIKWDLHIQELSKSLAKVIYQLRILKNVLPDDALISVYYANFQSLLQYGIIFWANNSYAKGIFRIQKRAIRILCNLGARDSCRQSFRDLQIMPLMTLFIFNSVIFAKRYFDNFKLNNQVHSYSTRRQNNIHVSYRRTTQAGKSVYHTTVDLFNNLPSSLKNIKNFDKFKAEAKKYFKMQSFYTIEEYFD